MFDLLLIIDRDSTQHQQTLDRFGVILVLKVIPDHRRAPKFLGGLGRGCGLRRSRRRTFWSWSVSGCGRWSLFCLPLFLAARHGAERKRQEKQQNPCHGLYGGPQSKLLRGGGGLLLIWSQHSVHLTNPAVPPNVPIIAPPERFLCDNFPAATSAAQRPFPEWRRESTSPRVVGLLPASLNMNPAPTPGGEISFCSQNCQSVGRKLETL